MYTTQYLKYNHVLMLKKEKTKKETILYCKNLSLNRLKALEAQCPYPIFTIRNNQGQFKVGLFGDCLSSPTKEIHS